MSFQILPSSSRQSVSVTLSVPVSTTMEEKLNVADGYITAKNFEMALEAYGEVMRERLSVPGVNNTDSVVERAGKGMRLAHFEIVKSLAESGENQDAAAKSLLQIVSNGAEQALGALHSLVGLASKGLSAAKQCVVRLINRQEPTSATNLLFSIASKGSASAINFIVDQAKAGNSSAVNMLKELEWETPVASFYLGVLCATATKPNFELAEEYFDKLTGSSLLADVELRVKNEDYHAADGLATMYMVRYNKSYVDFGNIFSEGEKKYRAIAQELLSKHQNQIEISPSQGGGVLTETSELKSTSKANYGTNFEVESTPLSVHYPIENQRRMQFVGQANKVLDETNSLMHRAADKIGRNAQVHNDINKGTDVLKKTLNSGQIDQVVAKFNDGVNKIFK